jgi:hypothetical protein
VPLKSIICPVAPDFVVDGLAAALVPAAPVPEPVTDGEALPLPLPPTDGVTDAISPPVTAGTEEAAFRAL